MYVYPFRSHVKKQPFMTQNGMMAFFLEDHQLRLRPSLAHIHSLPECPQNSPKFPYTYTVCTWKYSSKLSLKIQTEEPVNDMEFKRAHQFHLFNQPKTTPYSTSPRSQESSNNSDGVALDSGIHLTILRTKSRKPFLLEPSRRFSESSQDTGRTGFRHFQLPISFVY